MNKSIRISYHISNIAHRFLPIGFAMLVLALFSACKSVKPASSTYDSPNIATAPVAERYDALVASYADWTDVSMPVRLSISSPQNFSVTAQCEMKRNSWVQFSVRMLGFEVAKVWIDNDSIHAVDKYHRRYLSESLRRFLGSNDVTVGNLQDLLLGRAFLTGKGGGTLDRADISHVQLVSSDEGMMILPKVEPTDFNYGFILDNATNNVAAASIVVGDLQTVILTYSTFYATDAGPITSVASMKSVKGKPVDLSLTWNLQSAKWNRELNRYWTAPSGYSRMDVGQLLKLMSTTNL